MSVSGKSESDASVSGKSKSDVTVSGKSESDVSVSSKSESDVSISDKPESDVSVLAFLGQVRPWLIYWSLCLSHSLKFVSISVLCIELLSYQIVRNLQIYMLIVKTTAQLNKTST